MCGSAGHDSNQIPTWTAATVPTMYCPCPPMLKRPPRNANATAIPVRSSGVIWMSVCCRLSAEVHGNEQVCHGRSQFSPEPLKISLYVPSGLLPVNTSTTRPPTRKARRAVRSGVTSPPARCVTVRRRASTSSARPGRGRLPRVRRSLSRRLSARPPVMAIPSSSSVTDGAYSPTIRPSYRTRMRSESDRISSSSSETSSTAVPPFLRLDELLVHELDRTDVEAAGRLRRDQDARLAAELAGEHDLLLVSARERCRPRVRPAAADVETLEQPPCPAHELLRKEPAEAGVRLLVVVVQGDVLGEREVEHEAAALAILRDVADADVEDLARAVRPSPPCRRPGRARRPASAARSGRRSARSDRCRRLRRCRRSRPPAPRRRRRPPSRALGRRARAAPRPSSSASPG